MKPASLVILFSTVLFAAGCVDENKSAEGDSYSVEGKGRIIAVVNGSEIPELRISVYSPVAGAQPPEAVLENIISSELIMQAARKQGMHKMPDISEQLKIAEQSVLGGAYTQNFIATHPVSEETVAARYEELRQSLEGQNEYRTAHILVEDEALAKDLHAQISADGGKFAALAGEHSIDAGSARQGGELGWTEPRALVPEYAAAMQQTEPGALAPAPVQTQFGWHIIRVDEKRPLSVPALDGELRHNIEQSVRAEMFSQHLEELRTAAEIVRN